ALDAGRARNGDVADQASPWREGISDDPVPPDDGASGGGSARVLRDLQSGHRTREPLALRHRDQEPAAVVLRSLLVEMGTAVPQPVGGRTDDDHLPGRTPRCPEAALRGRG